MEQDRYSRQRRLQQVGDAGQARLERASLTVAASPAAGSELSYLSRAGVRAVLISRYESPLAFAHAGFFRHAATRELGAGAWRALRQIKAILEAS